VAPRSGAAGHTAWEVPVKRTWTTVGAPLVKDAAKMGRRLDRMSWFPVDETTEFGFMQGSAINTAVRELRIPKVGRVAIGAFNRYTLIGIEGQYKNGRARVYLVDTGVELVPVASDFYGGEVAA
jgi:hypothetical protein